MNQLEKQSYYLEPGYVYMSRLPSVIQTVLGNCVSVCLWDCVSRIGAMNHFLYPTMKDAAEATTIYGNVAVFVLLKMMKHAGCRNENLVAHILGGARSPLNQEETIGDKNVKIAKQYLNRREIEVVSEDVGGTIGRKIMFDTSTGHIAVLKVHNLRQSDWISEE